MPSATRQASFRASAPRLGGHLRASGSASPPRAARAPQIADAIAAGQITIPIAARFPLEQIQQATALQADRHVHGTIVVTL